MRRVMIDRVVPPTTIAGELSNRHQLDGSDTELRDLIEPADRRIEGSLGRERPDVELVDDLSRRSDAAPLVVRPRERRVIHEPRWSVDPVRLGLRSRIGQRRAPVDRERVIASGLGTRGPSPPAMIVRTHWDRSLFYQEIDARGSR